MKNDALKYGVPGLLIGAAIVWLVMTTLESSSSPNELSNGTSTQSQVVQSATMDAHFIEQMIPHHEDAITMAELALTRAQRPEVKQLAQNIIDSQGTEIEQMRGWYKDWFGRELPTGDEVMTQHGMMGSEGMHMGMMGNESDVQRLEEAIDFDRAFVEHMIPHHQMAVMMASMLKNGSQRPEMRQMADDIIAAQTAEIDQMREWLQLWPTTE